MSNGTVTNDVHTYMGTRGDECSLGSAGSSHSLLCRKGRCLDGFTGAYYWSRNTFGQLSEPLRYHAAIRKAANKCRRVLVKSLAVPLTMRDNHLQDGSLCVDFFLLCHHTGVCHDIAASRTMLRIRLNVAWNEGAGVDETREQCLSGHVNRRRDVMNAFWIGGCEHVICVMRFTGSQGYLRASLRVSHVD